jgi:hypothetical protein
MPTRILREGIITSESVNKLTDRSEVLYRRLFSVVDDYGRYYAHPSLIRAACYPLKLDDVSEANVKQMLSEIVAVDGEPLIFIYGGGKYVQLNKFRQQTRSPSKFPEPHPDELLIKCKADVNQMCSESESESESKTNAKTVAVEVIPDGLNTEAFKEAWGRWHEHLKSKRKPATPHARELQLKKLSSIGETRAVAALNFSIEKNWQGIYEESRTGGGQTNQPNSRNAGASPPAIEYAATKPRAQREREAREAAAVGKPVDALGSPPLPTQGSSQPTV